MEPHHIFSRRHLSCRWDIGNGFTLDHGHHRLGMQDPEKLRDVIIAQIGQEKFNGLKARAFTITHYKMGDLRGIRAALEVVLGEIERVAKSGMR